MKNNIWEEYHTKKINFFSIGLRYEDERHAVAYFCTPKDAKIFASTGCDGIHFCTVPKFGEMIFVVVPDGMTEQYVFPVAKDMEEFFSLVAALHGATLFDCIPNLPKARFEEVLAEQIAGESDECREELSKFISAYHPKPYKDSPYDAVRSLYWDFDFSRIEYTEEYYDVLGLDYPPQVS